MVADDFIYDGTQLSDLGFMIGYLDDADAVGTVETDSQRSFNSFSLFGGKWQPLSFTTYKNSLQIEMSVIKNPCAGSDDDPSISLAEIRRIKRWLNRPTYHELRIVNPEYEHVFWMGSANVEEIHHLGKCVGFHITFSTDRPFALGDTENFHGEVASNGTVTINDISDEIGYIYPDFEITLLDNGDLEIINSFDGRITDIKGCSSGETITMSKVMQITSSLPAHKVYNDFNWRFPRICNSYESAENVFSFSLPCTYSISYNPIVKAVIA